MSRLYNRIEDCCQTASILSLLWTCDQRPVILVMTPKQIDHAPSIIVHIQLDFQKHRPPPKLVILHVFSAPVTSLTKRDLIKLAYWTKSHRKRSGQRNVNCVRIDLSRMRFIIQIDVSSSIILVRVVPPDEVAKTAERQGMEKR